MDLAMNNKVKKYTNFEKSKYIKSDKEFESDAINHVEENFSEEIQGQQKERIRNNKKPKVLMDSGFLDSEMEIETVEGDDKNQTIIKRYFFYHIKSPYSKSFCYYTYYVL